MIWYVARRGPVKKKCDVYANGKLLDRVLHHNVDVINRHYGHYLVSTFCANLCDIVKTQ
jgi:hypothetical protein